MPKFDTATSNSALSNGRSWGVKRTLSCGRIAYEIDTLLDRHKVEDNPVLRRERVDIFLPSSSVSPKAYCALLVENRLRASANVIHPRWSGCNADNERASVASVVPSSLVTSGGLSPVPNSFPIRLIFPSNYHPAPHLIKAILA